MTIPFYIVDVFTEKKYGNHCFFDADDLTNLTNAGNYKRN
jgi:predicted PhzF superfamily epimerase YddE/YHI9